MKFLSTILICTFAFLFHTQEKSTRTIQGTVIEADSATPLAGAAVLVKGTSKGTHTDAQGKFSLSIEPSDKELVITYVGFETQHIKIGKKSELIIKMKSADMHLNEVVVTGSSKNKIRKRREKSMAYDMEGRAAGVKIHGYSSFNVQPAMEEKEAFGDYYQLPHDDFNTEAYDAIVENEFRAVTNHPLSTFSIDVDRASYANMRRFLNQNQLPPKDAVRIEEMINYFDYSYPQPTNEHPFSIHTELAVCPWNTDHQVLHIGLQGKELNVEEAPASNLVFLIDVSGSMGSPNKLPLLKQAFNLLTDNLRAEDRVAIVVYAGAAGLVLPSTAGNNKRDIRKAFEKMNAGGSTAGGAGIKLAYNVAKEHFIEGGNNRVILATDGDFNIGESSDAAMTRLIEEKRKDGIFLTVLGFGMGNYKDSKMEKIADKGNGNYAYIDNLMEAKKVLVNEMSGTLYTIAKDVKLQLEFNPTYVKSYRLIGYENRMLNKEDFNDDTKDAGELGAGHTVTAIYELIPAGSAEKTASVDPLKYQETNTTKAAKGSKELLTVKFRYKKPDEDKSKLLVHTLGTKVTPMKDASENLMFSSSVAEFGMLLRDSKFKENASFASVLSRARSAKGKDNEGYRAEFIRLVEMTEILHKNRLGTETASGEEE